MRTSPCANPPYAVLDPGRRTAGSALLMALLAVVVIGMMSAALFTLSQQQTRRESSSSDKKRAFYMAEAGLAESFMGLQFGKSGNVGTWAAPARFGNGLFVVEATPLENHQVTLQSTGMMNSGRAVLSLVAERGEMDLYSLGFFSGGSLTIGAGVQLDGYDSTLGSYGSQDPLPAPLGANFDVTIDATPQAQTTVHGDVTIGPDGTLDVAKKATLIGETFTASEELQLPPVQVPDVVLGPPTQHTDLTPLVIPPGRVALEALEVGTDAVVILTGPMSLVADRLVVRAGGELTFDTTAGSVEVHISDDLVFEPGSALLNTTQDPGELSIQLAGAPTEGVHLDSTGTFEGVLYAPDATVYVGGELEVFGTLVAGELHIEPGGAVHFDLHLLELAAESSLPRVISWRILDLEAGGPGTWNTTPFERLGVNEADLEPPAKSHEDQFLEISYVDDQDITRNYAGLESAFDWTEVVELLKASRDGELFTLPKERETEPPAEVATPTGDESKQLLDDTFGAGLNSAELRDKLVLASPLSEEILLAAANCEPPLESWALTEVFTYNRPVPDEVLSRLLDNSPMASADITFTIASQLPVSDAVLMGACGGDSLESWDLVWILVNNSPLSPEVLDAALGRVPPLSPSETADVLANQ